MEDSRSDFQLEWGPQWLVELTEYKNNIPTNKIGWIRTRHMNKKSSGCFICGRKTNVTRHHISRNPKPVIAVYICWKEHRILHGVALEKVKLHDLRRVMAIGDAYDLWKVDEKGMVRKKILTEMERREHL